MKRFWLILLLFSFLLNIILAGLFISSRNSKTLPPVQENVSYRLVKPLQKVIIDDESTPQLILQYEEIKPKIVDKISQYTKDDGNVGLFLQDLQTGSWLGINEKHGFIPASLLKVPIMIAILKNIERGELKLSDLVEISDIDKNSDSGNLFQKPAGTQISVQDLLEEMILNSDNTAKNVLQRKLSEAEANAIFKHVGIDDPFLSIEGTVTPRGYIRLFKSLYFSTFLSPEYSEKALDLTTDTQLESLLSAGVPYEIQIAHKFGYWNEQNGLSDCGIIYEPVNPYVLCVMVKNIEIDKGTELISSISKIIYDFVAAKSKGQQ